MNEIEYVPRGAEVVDCMGGYDRHTVKVHNHGFVSLVDVMPRMVPADRMCESAIVQAARVSYGQGLKTIKEDISVMRYLLSHRHTTPFEMVEFKFHAKMPVFVARQWIRHRTANVNEYSGRYSEIKDERWEPEGGWRSQSTTNKQGSGAGINYVPTEWSTGNDNAYVQVEDASYHEYQQRIEAGMAREIARCCLPQSMYTEWYWKIDLHNLLHFLSLRADSHAQQEIQDFANPMLALITPLIPNVIQAWNDYSPWRDAVTISAPEQHYITTGDSSRMSKRELEAFPAKAAKLGLKIPTT